MINKVDDTVKQYAAPALTCGHTAQSTMLEFIRERNERLSEASASNFNPRFYDNLKCTSEESKSSLIRAKTLGSKDGLYKGLVYELEYADRCMLSYDRLLR